MRERPILFSAPMVRAILAGRKTQTRRVVKPQLDLGRDLDWQSMPPLNGKARYRRVGADYPDTEKEDGIVCPYGQPNDRLWVRETWSQPTSEDPGPTFYRADYPDCVPRRYENVPAASEIRWKPSIHMPRAASRITLEVTGVRVERLQDISEADAQAEGCAPSWLDADDNDTVHAQSMPTYRQGFARIWHDINGAGSWHSNPWVWVVEFRRIEQEAQAA